MRTRVITAAVLVPLLLLVLSAADFLLVVFVFVLAAAVFSILRSAFSILQHFSGHARVIVDY